MIASRSASNPPQTIPAFLYLLWQVHKWVAYMKDPYNQAYR